MGCAFIVKRVSAGAYAKCGLIRPSSEGGLFVVRLLETRRGRRVAAPLPNGAPGWADDHLKRAVVEKLCAELRGDWFMSRPYQ